MVTPELKWPTTNLTPSAANLSATDTPSFGIGAVVADAEHDLLAQDAAGFALMSSTACSTPCLSWAPNAALPPVIGPPTPILTSACAPPASATPSAKPRAAANTGPDVNCEMLNLMAVVSRTALAPCD